MATENIDIVIKEIGATETANSMKRIGTDAASAVAPVGGLNSAIESLKGTLVSLGLLLSGKQILDMADHYTVVIDKLKKYATSNEDLIQTEQKLNDIALATRQRMDEVASVYTGLARASQGAGVSQKELLDATTSISKAMTTMGASAGDVSEVMKRLAFSMQSGMQPGRAIAQLFIQFPALGAAISKELGISAKEFLNMAHSGQLSMKQIVDAMASAGQEGKTLSNSFNATTVTLSSAFTTLGGQVARAIGLFDQGSGVSRAFAESVLFLANHIDGVLVLVRAFSVGLAAYAVATYAASAATVTFTGALTTVVAILSRPAVLIAAAAAAISLLITYFKDFKLTADGSVTAMGVLSGAFNLVKEAALAVWNLALKPLIAMIESSPALFAAASIAVGAFGVALSAALTASVVSTISSVIAGIVGLTTAAYALLVPVGQFVIAFAGAVAGMYLVTAAVLGLSDALGFTKGALEDFNKKIEEVANNVATKVTKTFADATAAAKAHALAQVEVKAKTDEATNSAAAASAEWHKTSDAFKEVHTSANGAADAIKSLGESYLNGASDADKFADANKKFMDSLLNKTKAVSADTKEADSNLAAWLRVNEGERHFEDLNKKAIEDLAKLQAAYAKARSEAAGMAAAMGMTEEEFKKAQPLYENLNATIKDGAVLWNDWATAAEAAADAASNAAAKASTAWKNANAGGKGSPDSVGSSSYGPQNQFTATMDKDAAASALYFAGPAGRVNYDPWYIATFGNVTTQDALDRWKALNGLAHGGQWTVGGQGGTDSQLVQFMASPDEEVTVRTPSQQRDNSDRGDTIIVNMHINGVQDTRDFNRNMGQIASKVRSQLSRRT